MIASYKELQDDVVAQFLTVHRSGAWYLEPEAGSCVLPGTVPVDPVCLKSSSWETHLHFDMSLSTCVVDDAQHRHLKAVLRGQQHCSLISASGAGKTKAVMDALKVRCQVIVPVCGSAGWP